MKKKTEYRSGELRAINEDGTFEGYLTVWDTVDDYNSTFQRGAFKKTIQERGSRVKILYNHEHLIGSSVELREDDHGVFGIGKLNLNTDKAKEAYEFMKDGTLDGLSFGFRVIKEGFESGVRQIKEVALFEFGPVTFPANDAAVITSVRSTDFAETLSDHDLRRQGYALMTALESTLSDIWWGEDGDKLALLDSALSDFHAGYLEYANAFIARFYEDGNRAIPSNNELSQAVLELRETPESLAASTSLTVAEVEQLLKGQLIDARHKLNELPESIKQAHQQLRVEKIESLCAELRAGLTDAEKRRINALLQPAVTQSQPNQDMSAILNFLKDCQQAEEQL